MLGRWSSLYPHLQYIFEPAREWLASEEAINVQLELSHEESSNSVEALLNTMLYTAQVMVAETTKADVDAPEDEDTDQQVLKAYRETRTFTHLLSLDRILEQLSALLENISTGPELQHILQRIMPFLDVYQDLVQNQLAIHAQWTKALFKLDYALCSTLLRLAREGFCQPPETEEGGDGEGESLEAADGTGLGEGSGTENISKEVEDESQVEGLKGEDEGNQERNKDDGDDNAVEMSEDFGGTLEDIPDDGSQEEGEDESDEESEADPEERIEDLDPSDPSALDEKIWGDESGPQDTEDTEDKTGKDHSEEQGGSSEVVAKENKEKSKKDKEKEKESDVKEQDEEAPNTEEQGEQEEEGEPNAAGAPMEDYVQDANTLDLPDDMELDAGEEEKKNMSEDELEGEGEEGLPEEKMGDDGGPDNDVPFEDKQPENVECNEPQEEAVDDEDMEMDGKMEARADDEPLQPDGTEDEDVPEDVTARPDTSAGDGDVNPNDEAQAQDQDAGSSGQAGSTAANQGQKNTSQDKVVEQTGYVSLFSLCSAY